MSKQIKNVEINFESKAQFIAHQRPMRIEDGRVKPQDLNFWKIFSKMPRTNSLQQSEEKVEDGQSKQD